MIGTTPAEIDARVLKSRRGLAAWRHEAALPWRDVEMMRSLLSTEIGILEALRNADEGKRAKIHALMGKYRELLEELVHDAPPSKDGAT